MPKSHNQLLGKPRVENVRQCGMTMLELLIAMAVLAIGMTGAMGMILAGVRSNSRNKNDTAAVVLDQEILEEFATFQTFPSTGTVMVNDCGTGAASQHQASVVGSVLGLGAATYTPANAPFPANVGDIDWTQPAPVMATVGTPGYAMNYQTCNGDIFEVRWNVMWIFPMNGTSRIAALTVSSRQTASANSKVPMLFSTPTTLHTIIDY
jgi:prepilin-type N-terminal cleavage/methylation domain-containing protein